MANILGMKKLIAVAAALALVAVPSAASAGKKKGPAPYKSETVAVATGHPVLHSATGTLLSVTAQEFMNTCAIPGSNGLDAYVFEVPAEYQKINAYLSATATAPSPAGYDLDAYLFDAECQLTQAVNAEGTDQEGSVLKGTAYILIHNYLPGPMDAQIELKPL